MSKNQLTLVYSILLLSALLMPTFAVAQEEPTAITMYSLQGDNQQTYIIPWFVLDAGGTVEEAISANYRLKDAIGQPVTGKCENANYRLYVGFLAAPEYVEKAFPVEEITIGDDGNPCFSFAIIADPEYDSNNPSSINNLVDAVTEIINRNTEEFVIVLGDLIQGEGEPLAWKGETDYGNEFNPVKTELDRLETAGIHYIPMPGNHDVWFKYPDGLTGGYSTVGGPPDYPEELFADIFDSQYDELSQDLGGWIDQRESMHIDNPYDDLIPEKFPDIYFQNFAFDYGPYHFICLDLNSRKDFDPIVIESLVNPKLKNVWGYADLHDFTDGTLDWLDKHLDEWYVFSHSASTSTSTSERC